MLKQMWEANAALCDVYVRWLEKQVAVLCHSIYDISTRLIPFWKRRELSPTYGGFSSVNELTVTCIESRNEV